MFSAQPNQTSSNLDMSYKQHILKLIEEIKSTEEEEELFQPLTPVSKFFETLKKIESSELKNKLFQTAFLEFSSQPNIQWIAFKIAKEEAQSKNTYLFDLIESCKKTNSKEMAFKTAGELEISSYKKNNVFQDITNYFSL